jgi:hypothetical protein
MRTGLICRSFYRNRQSGFAILVVFPEEAWLGDFVTRPALIPSFSRPWSLLPMELAQFQIAFQFCRDHLALPAPAFVSYSVFVLLMVKYRLGRKGLE